MTLKHEYETEIPQEIYPSAANWRRGIEWFFGIVGAVALFLGFFITFAGENQYVGIGGDWSWRVGDIDTIWPVGFFIGGGLLLLGVLGSVLMGRARR